MQTVLLKSVLLFIVLLLCYSVHAQHTFSIVAVDPSTGEVGAAGATCLTSEDCNGCGGAVIISAIFPGVGAINSQAQVCIPNVNGNNGMNQMISNDLSANETLQWMLDNDACQFGGTANRQYGVIKLKDELIGEAAAFTGNAALDYASHLVGTNYAIQGNILIGPEVLEGMEQGFLNTEGCLAEKLMAAMQGANIPGADSRCLPDGISSKSAFLRVARQDDPVNDLYINIIVPSTNNLEEPIDSLQNLFNLEVNCVTSSSELENKSNLTIFPNPATDHINIVLDEITLNGETILELYNEMGMKIQSLNLENKFNQISLQEINSQSGLLIYKIFSDQYLIGTGKLIIQK